VFEAFKDGGYYVTSSIIVRLGEGGQGRAEKVDEEIGPTGIGFREQHTFVTDIYLSISQLPSHLLLQPPPPSNLLRRTVRNTRPRPRRKQITHPPRIHLPPAEILRSVRQLRKVDARRIPHPIPLRHTQPLHLAKHLVRTLRRTRHHVRPVRRRGRVHQRFREPVPHGAGAGVRPHPRVPVRLPGFGLLEFAAGVGHGGGAVGGVDGPGLGEALLAQAGDAVGGGAVGLGHRRHCWRRGGRDDFCAGGGAEDGGPGRVFGGEEGGVGGGEGGVGGGGPGGEGGVRLGVVGGDGGEFGGGGGLVEGGGPGGVLLGLGGEDGGGDGVVD